MWTRLALSLHASRTHDDFDLCEVEEDRLQSPGVPGCLHGAVRFLIPSCRMPSTYILFVTIS